MSETRVCIECGAPKRDADHFDRARVIQDALDALSDNAVKELVRTALGLMDGMHVLDAEVDDMRAALCKALLGKGEQT